MAQAAQAAVEACTAKGFKQGSEEFKRCAEAFLLQRQGGGQTATSVQRAAENACEAKGLASGTEDFKKCVTGRLQAAGQGAGGGQAASLQQAALDACRAKGLPVGSEELKSCVAVKLQGAAAPLRGRITIKEWTDAAVSSEGRPGRDKNAAATRKVRGGDWFLTRGDLVLLFEGRIDNLNVQILSVFPESEAEQVANSLVALPL